MVGMYLATGSSPNQDGSVNFYHNDHTEAGAPAPNPQVGALLMPVLENAWIKPHDTSDQDHLVKREICSV